MKLIPETPQDHLRVYIKENFGTQSAAAKAFDLPVSYLSSMVTGKRPMNKKLLDLVGFEWRLVKKSSESQTA